jgi:hypothetical protein
LTNLASDTAYHSFAGEVEARTPPRYAARIVSTIVRQPGCKFKLGFSAVLSVD